MRTGVERRLGAEAFASSEPGVRPAHSHEVNQKNKPASVVFRMISTGGFVVHPTPFPLNAGLQWPPPYDGPTGQTGECETPCGNWGAVPLPSLCTPLAPKPG